MKLSLLVEKKFIKDVLSGTYQLLCAIQQPEFILVVYILGKILSMSLPFNKFL